MLSYSCCFATFLYGLFCWLAEDGNTLVRSPTVPLKVQEGGILPEGVMDFSRFFVLTRTDNIDLE